MAQWMNLLQNNSLLYPGVWADQRNHQGGYLVIPQCAGWIISYPPVVIGYIMQT